jgi:hypothetical protein
VLMGFPRLGAAFYTETAHECTYSQLYDMRHAWYVVPQCRPLDSRGLKCWLQLACNRVIEEALCIVIPSKWPSVSSKQSSTSFTCTASLVPVCWPVTYHPLLAFETGKEQVNNLIASELNFMQCQIPIHIVGNDRCDGQWVRWCPSVQR